MRLTTAKQNEILLNEIRESREDNKKYFEILSTLISTVNTHAKLLDQHDALIK